MSLLFPRARKVLLCIGMIVLISGCATVTPPPPVSLDKEVYLKDLCAHNGVSWQWDAVSQVATLNVQGIHAEVLVGSDLVVVNKERVTLSGPVRMENSAVVVPVDFRAKVINRLQSLSSRQPELTLTKVRSIIIDAGHGGKDPGAISRGGIQEKGIVLDISSRLEKILKERGYEVTMTRKSDEFISLGERTEIASRSRADLFVSIHANSSPARNVYGMEVYTAKPLDFHDQNEDQRKINHGLMFQNLKMADGVQDVEIIVSDMLYTYKQEQSKRLAEHVSDNTSRRVKTINRGDKSARFYVLRNTLMPAVLIEVGFLTNPKELQLLQTVQYRELLALGIADSIVDYANDL